MNTKYNRQKAHDDIDHIFKDLLPAQGMEPRPAQVALCHEMLDAMLEGRIALCDAGTGIGKTYAYLVAGTVFHRYRAADGLPLQPIIISTSSIALQNAVLGEYLPFLSSLLLADGLLKAPLRAVIRKGKAHYVCDQRLEQRLKQVDLNKKNQRAGAALLSLRHTLDMDGTAHLSGYDRVRVCVPALCDCRLEDCRYRRFLDACGALGYQFQICNHNLLLADAIHRGRSGRPILPPCAALVMDEAHKLPEAARQMFGVTLTNGDFRRLILDLKTERYVLAAETLEDAVKPLLRLMAQPPEEHPLEDCLHCLLLPGRALEVISRQLHRLLTPATHRRLEEVASKVFLFSEGCPGMVLYTAGDADGGTMLCATASDLTAQLRRVLWSQRLPMILTSGTLAVGRDFRRFRAEAGLPADGRVTESVSLSPFDYRRNCLLYLPPSPPRRRDGGTAAYYDALAAEIAALLRAAHGHALVLFTSYADLAAVKARLEAASLPYPLFALGRNAPHTTRRFKERPGGVLLATGAAWEGFDFPGDCVSLLVIPRLPFAYPDALKEKERENYPSLRAFIRAVVVPEMQIKLKQGFGRAIRTETDTCVVAILDERAGHGRRYFHNVASALPEMDTTTSLREVERFLRAVKPDSYFQEAA